VIQTFVNRYMAARDALRAEYAKGWPDNYEAIVKSVVTVIQSEDGSYDDFDIDPDRIHLIDDGDNRGTLLFVIACKSYQPSRYWAVKVGYGSCSGCDTLQSLRVYSDDPPSEEGLDGLMTLSLHVVQGLVLVGGEE